jgi:Transposase DDE domain.
MQTECKPEELLFQELENRNIIVKNDAGTTSSDGGLLFLRQIDKKFSLIEKLAEHFNDFRSPLFIDHSLETLLRQRIFGICLGYEDLNDHDQWRKDPLLAVACDVDPSRGFVAGKSTLNRLEGTPEICASLDRYKRISWHEEEIRKLLIDCSLSLYKKAPRVIILDFDTTDTILYGNQEGRFFSGYYDEYCYQPLYVFADDLLLCSELFTMERDITPQVLSVLELVAKKIRARCPKTKVIIRGDSGFCRESLMSFCEQNTGFYYVFGLPKNKRLVRAIGGSIKRVEALYKQDGKPHREYRELRYRTRKTWSIPRRVVGKAEHLPKGSNPRFVVTNIDPDWWPAQKLYEKLYCARGNMENRIKEQKLDLFSDRASTHNLRTNQLRLWFSSFAYFFAVMLKRTGLSGSAMAAARLSTIRLKILKVAALVSVSVRRVVIRLPRSFPYWDYWKLLHQRLHTL